MSALLAETAASFHAAQTHSIVGVWTDTNSTDVMLNGYDMPTIGRDVDMVALMAYGMTQCACGDAMCEVSACNPDRGCRCAKPGANSDLHYVARFARAYLQRVDASKLVVVWPAYGVQFTCAAGTGGKTCNSPAWYSALSYHAAEALLANVTANQSLIASTFDSASSSRYFRWHDDAAKAEKQVWCYAGFREKTLEGPFCVCATTNVFCNHLCFGITPVAQGSSRVDDEYCRLCGSHLVFQNIIMEPRWDDAHSIGVKCAWAKRAGLRGVGFYQGTGAYPDGANGSMAAMYSAVRKNFLQGAIDY